ncbi:MAG: PepSY-like domain-containing protein [Lentimicrobiaceae bacterium]|nr:PepSY-like domain-containing protein [Lentimicrobiaceae bacterium]MCO5265826.1 hypothetical protein [Lentimicrobium sp.]HPG32630.1 hypothetical protein [Lentimicrobium sp.]
MKKQIIPLFQKASTALVLLIIMASGLTVSGQIPHTGLEKIPEGIKTAFTKKYATASEINWLLSDGLYVISFKAESDYLDAFYDAQAKWVKTEKAVLFNQLPKTMQDSLKAGEFGTWEKGSAYQVDLPGSIINYKIFVYSKDWNEMELIFDKTGKRLLQ